LKKTDFVLKKDAKIKQMSSKITFSKIRNKFADAFPLPYYLSLKPMGIDITSNAVRFVKFKKTVTGYIPILHKEIIFKKSINIADMDQMSDVEIDLIVQILKKIKNDYDIEYVVTSLPEEKNYFYRTNLPYEAIQNIPSAIRFSLEENVPLSVKEVNFAYEILEITEKEIDVVVSVFPKSVVSFYTDILNKAGLKPLSFQSESVALSNSISKKGDKDLYLLIRLLEDRVNVAITEGGAVQYTSSIRIPTSGIVSDFGGPEAKKLIQELNKILIYWFTSKKEAKEQHKIEKAIIAGDGANTEGLEEFIEAALKVDVKVANVWENCFKEGDHIADLPADKSLKYAVAIGLALNAIEFK
jgi:Tfp pilus assembly PilM family ATPase